MRKSMFLSFVVGSLALLTSAETAQAHGWSVRLGGISFGRGHHGHWYGGYYDGYYRPYRGYYYGGPTYYYSYPEYYMDSGTRSYRSFYPESDRRAQIRVVVPHPEARLWIDDTQMDQLGMNRLFVTPDLKEGVIHSYNIKVTWTEDGQEISRTKKIEFRAGEQATLRFGVRDGGNQLPKPREERIRTAPEEKPER